MVAVPGRWNTASSMQTRGSIPMNTSEGSGGPGWYDSTRDLLDGMDVVEMSAEDEWERFSRATPLHPGPAPRTATPVPGPSI
jgi:hypothetical protein